MLVTISLIKILKGQTGIFDIRYFEVFEYDEWMKMAETK